MVKYEDLAKLSISELKAVIQMSQDIRTNKGGEIVRKMIIGQEFQITGDKNRGKIFILSKINRTKIIGKEKNGNNSYTIPFGMVIVD